MPDICDLIVDDHEAQRRAFEALYAHQRADSAGLARLWEPLASLLEVHAAAEEATFYPVLVRHGGDGTEETLDAIKDHNKIRDAVATAKTFPPGTGGWWDAVNKAQQENDDHMREEENGGIPDFRAHSDPGLAAQLGDAFVAFKLQHEGGRLDVADKDPQTYVAEQTPSPPGDGQVP